MARVDLITRRIQRGLGDLGQNSFSKPEIYDALNRIQIDICRRGLALKVRSQLNLVVGTEIYTLSPPIYKLHEVFPPTHWRIPLQFISDIARWKEIVSHPLQHNIGRIFYVFTVSGIIVPPQPNDVYSNNQIQFTIYAVTLTQTNNTYNGTITCTASGSPLANGQLVRVSGNGDTSINYSSVSQGLTGLQPRYIFVWNKELHFWPLPSVSQTLNMWYYAVPATSLIQGIDPEIGTEWDDALMWGALDYLKPDPNFKAKYETELRLRATENVFETTMPIRTSSWADELEAEIFG